MPEPYSDASLQNDLHPFPRVRMVRIKNRKSRFLAYRTHTVREEFLKTSPSSPPSSPLTQEENNALRSPLISPSRRTASPKPTDSESARHGLPFCINGTDGCHTNEFRNVPPLVPFLLGMPINKGLSHGRATRFSLPSPSRFQSPGSHGRAHPQKREGCSVLILVDSFVCYS